MGTRKKYQFPFASFPAVRIMLLMIAGIMVGHLLQPTLPLILGSFSFIFIIWILFEFALRRKFAVLSTHTSIASYMVFIFVAAMALQVSEKQKQFDLIEQSKPLGYYAWEELVIEGEITSSGRSSSGRNVYTVDIQQTELPEGLVWLQEYKLRLYDDGNRKQALIAGSEIQAEIRLYEFPERRNPHEFDYGRWLHSQGISAHGELQSGLKKEDSQIFSWGPIRHSVQRNIDQLFSKKHASLAKALLLGYKDDLTPETKQQFSRAGLSHIMAVSGLHVGFIVAPFWLLIPFLWGSNKGKWIGLIVLTILLICYAGLTGFSASVSRASLMAWLLTYGRLFHKVRNSINLTAVAAIILLIIQPNQLFDAGFQLSFSAVFIILLVMPEAKRLIPQRIQFRWSGGLATIILVSIVVQLGLFPILIRYFGEFSLVGPLANALVIPVLTILVPIGLVVVLASPLIPVIAEAIAIPLQYSLEWIGVVASSLSSGGASFISMNSPSIFLFAVWLFALLTVASLRIPNVRWKMVIGLLIAVNGLLIESALKKMEPLMLEITVLDVGQGDAIHIKTPGDKHLLVDAGRWSPGGNSGDRVLLPYFERKGIDRLDAVILSHPHADHIGGVAGLLNQVEIDTIYQSDYDYDSNLYETYMRLAAEKQIPVQTPEAGDMIRIDPTVRLFVLGPGKREGSSNPNNRSIVFKLVYGNTSVLFSGDAEKQQERKLATRYGTFLDSDLYKVGHHASNTSSTEPFLELVEPEAAVASLSFRNKFDHPGPQTVSRLSRYSEKQDYTSLNGAIIYQSDGESFRKIDWR